MEISDRHFVLDQYRTATNLDARVALHERFSTNPYGWHRWVFDHLDLTPGQQILEIGCGLGHLWRNNLERIPRSWQVTLSDLSDGMLIEARRHLENATLFHFVNADAQQLQFGTDEFDVVIANHMLYHVPDRP